MSRHSFVRQSYLERFWKSYLQTYPLAQLDKWISQEFRLNKKLGKKDRKWFSDALFELARLSWDIARELSSDIQTPEHLITVLQTTPFDEQLRAKDEVLKSTEESLKKLSLLPPWCQDSLEKRCKESQWDEISRSKFLENHKTKPPLWIRLNHPEKKQELLSELQKENFSVLSLSFIDDAICISGTKSLYDLASFKSGVFEVQDLASQQIGSNIPVSKGDFIWDVCCGGGGKTLQLASRLGKKGCVYASDLREWKLPEVKKRAKRAEFLNIRTLVHDATKILSPPIEVKRNGGFDLVFVDAPCSSSGTWRRNPDGKMRLSRKSVDELTSLQLQILESSSLSLKPKSGTLVYATCSFFVEENEDIVRKFMKRNRGFKVQHQLNGSPLLDADTTFVAVFERIT